MIDLLIVDDHILFREGLASLFRAQPDFHVVGEAGTVREAVALALKLNPSLILMDFSLPDGTGLDATKQILSENPETNIVFLTMHEDDQRLLAAVRNGAKGYLLKNIPVTKLIESLRGLQEGEAPISLAMASRVMQAYSEAETTRASDATALDILTDREREILMEIGKGGTNREIAYRLFISENTVKNHVHNILEKLGLKNRREASRFAHEQGLVGKPHTN